MNNKRFNPAKLEKLNNPERVKEMPIDFMSEKSGVKNPKVIVDLGAGTGLFSKALADYYKNSTIYACDISPIMVDWMNENVKPNYDTIHPMLMGDASIDLADETADFLIMINLHHELDEPIKTVKEAYRLLKQGGSIAISDWRKEEMPKGPSLEIRVDAHEIKQQLEQCGFSQVQIFTEFRHNYLVIAKK